MVSIVVTDIPFKHQLSVNWWRWGYQGLFTQVKVSIDQDTHVIALIFLHALRMKKLRLCIFMTVVHVSIVTQTVSTWEETSWWLNINLRRFGMDVNETIIHRRPNCRRCQHVATACHRTTSKKSARKWLLYINVIYINLIHQVATKSVKVHRLFEFIF